MWCKNERLIFWWKVCCRLWSDVFNFQAKAPKGHKFLLCNILCKSLVFWYGSNLNFSFLPTRKTYFSSPVKIICLVFWLKVCCRWWNDVFNSQVKVSEEHKFPLCKILCKSMVFWHGSLKNFFIQNSLSSIARLIGFITITIFKPHLTWTSLHCIFIHGINVFKCLYNSITHPDFMQ